METGGNPAPTLNAKYRRTAQRVDLIVAWRQGQEIN
jgi:hypothetical protein